MPIQTFIAEVKRRRVFRVAAVYGVVGWLVMQAAALIFSTLSLPPAATQFVVVLVLLGFPIALVLAWAFELTPDGVRLTHKIDAETERPVPAAHWGWKRHAVAYLAVALLGIAATIAVSRWWLPNSADDKAPIDSKTIVAAPNSDAFPLISNQRKTIAVLPFVPLNQSEQDGYFADGLTEEIINALAQLEELRVTARTSAFHFKGKNVPIGEIGKALGVDHVLEGSVRSNAEQLRITAQLIRVSDGFHVWSKNYDRKRADTIAVQDDISINVANALHVLLNDEKQRQMKLAGIRDVDTFLIYQRAQVIFNEAHSANGELLPTLRRANEVYSEAIAHGGDTFVAFINRSDLATHLLLDVASGSAVIDATKDELARAPTELRSNLDLAYKKSTNLQEQTSVDQLRRFLSEDWSGLNVLTTRAQDFEQCLTLPFFHLTILFIQSEQTARFFDTRRSCDPLAPLSWRGYYEVALFTGDFEGAIQRVREAERHSGQHIVHSRVNITAHLAKGDFVMAEQLLGGPSLTDFQRAIFKVMLHAARGDIVKAQVVADKLLSDPKVDDIVKLQMAAWMGNRSVANATAARIDAHPLAAVALTQGIMWCACGAAFDLSATPNYKKRIEESGFQWPPKSVIKFPNKNW